MSEILCGISFPLALMNGRTRTDFSHRPLPHKVLLLQRLLLQRLLLNKSLQVKSSIPNTYKNAADTQQERTDQMDHRRPNGPGRLIFVCWNLPVTTDCVSNKVSKPATITTHKKSTRHFSTGPCRSMSGYQTPLQR